MFRIICLLLIAIYVFSGIALADTTYEDLAWEHPYQIERKNNTIRIMAVGDIMMHLPIVYNVRKGDRFAFETIFEHVKPFLETADLVVGNLETTLTSESEGFSGYPRFVTPDDLALGLKISGFDFLGTANNHSLDGGSKGVEMTLMALDNAGMQHVGTYLEGERAPVITQIKDLSIGWAAASYGTNGLRQNYENQVDLIDMERIADDLTILEEQGTDIQIILMHWGIEYQREPSVDQRQIADQLKDMGYDVVLGSHPHVLQEALVEQSFFCAYSMGNFLSNQRDGYKDLGVIVDLVLEKTSSGIQVRRAAMVPTWVDKYQEGQRGFKVVMLNPLGRTVEPTEIWHAENLLARFNGIFGDE